MNLTALDAAVRNRGFSFVNTATDPTSPIFIELNNAYRYINGAQRWPWLEKSATLATTTIGVDTYTLSSIADFRQLDAVRMTDSLGVNYELVNMEPQRFRTATFEQISLPIQTAPPQVWTQYAGSVKLWPVPDAAYSIIVDYIYQPVDLSAGTDVPVLPSVYHNVIVDRAVWALNGRERDWIGRQDADQAFQQSFSQMLNEYLLMQRQTASRVNKSGFYSNASDWSGTTGLV